ncbi:MAG: hypothetical protein HQ518_11490 [Rhodopirellula sp.]|nr:hypothetical protein [Rhodopirellula sp.]
MIHRRAEPLELQTKPWSADQGDDSIEFAEFTGDDAGLDEDSGGTGRAGAEEEPATAIQATSVEADPPKWFRRKFDVPSEADDSQAAFSSQIVADESSVADQAASRKRRGRKRGGLDDSQSRPAVASAALIEAADDEPEKLDWKKLAILWLVSNATCGYGVSFIVHAILLGGMSAIVYHSLDDNQSISMIITDVDAMPIEFTEIMDLTVEPAGSSQNQLPQLTKIPITTAEAEISSSLLDSTASVAGNNGDGGNTGEGFGFAFSMPEGGKAVSKGSFSAWTVPEDPKPGRDYMIVIRIRLPEETKQYHISDLSGKVEGTDLYVQYLPFDPTRKELVPASERGGRIIKLKSTSRLPVIKNHVQIMIPVPGASRLIRDTIHLKSRMLNEDQRLEIVF